MPSARPQHTHGLRARPVGEVGFGCLPADCRKAGLGWVVLGEMKLKHETKPERLVLL